MLRKNQFETFDNTNGRNQKRTNENKMNNSRQNSTQETRLMNTNHTKTTGYLRFSVKTNSSCSTCDTIRDTFVKPSMIDEINERRNCDYDKRIVPLSYMTPIVRN